jgi:hypothetical protein
MLYLGSAFAWFAFVLTGIAVIVVTEPWWNRAGASMRAAAARCCAQCPKAAPRRRLKPAGLHAS